MGFILDVFTRLEQLSKKDKAGYSDENAFNSNFNAFSIELNEYCIEQYRKTKKISDLIRQHLLPIEVAVGPGGIVSLPVNFSHLSSAIFVKSDGSQYEMKEWDSNELPSMLNNSIRGASLEKNKYRYFLSTNIQVYPKEAEGKVLLYYFRNPKPASIAFKYQIIAGEDVKVYDELNTIESEYPMAALNYFVYGMARNLGIEISDPELIQYALLPKNDGVLNAVK